MERDVVLVVKPYQRLENCALHLHFIGVVVAAVYPRTDMAAGRGRTGA